MPTHDVAAGVVDPGVGLRLLAALAASGAIHLSLLFTIRLAPPALPPPAPILHARLAPSTGHAAEDAAKPRNAVAPVRSATLRPRTVASHAAPQVQPARAEPTEVEQVAAVPEALPSIAVPFAPDLTWYPVRQLDVFPRALTALEPAYPLQASAEDMRGEVTLLLLIDEMGGVHEVSVVEAQPQGYFEEAAVAAFEGVRFEPARKDGRAVRSRVLVKVAFHPDARE